MELTRYVLTDRGGRILQTWTGVLPEGRDAVKAFKAELRSRGSLRELADGDPLPDPLRQRRDGGRKAFVDIESPDDSGAQ